MTFQDDLLEQMPYGMEKQLAKILMYHIGKNNACPRPVLFDKLARIGFRTNDRQMRAAINKLRKDGHRICSAGGNQGGYWIAKDWQELQEYIGSELHPRAMDLLEQENALKEAAKREWGEGQQLEMI